MVFDNQYAKKKLEVVDNIIQKLGRNTPVFVIDRPNVFSNEKEMNFQKARHHWLIWAINSGDSCVRERIRRLRLKIPKEWEGYEYLPKYNMPEEIMEIYFFIEDMEIALGTHPAIKERSR
jgi:hypothetical protein